MSDLKTYSLKEIAEHNGSLSSWILIHHKIYDVTKFLAEHPGGEEVLLERAGKESTEEFEDVGHSADAKGMMGKYLIEELCEEDKAKVKSESSWSADSSTTSSSSESTWVVPIVIAVLFAIFYRYLF